MMHKIVSRITVIMIGLFAAGLTVSQAQAVPFHYMGTSTNSSTSSPIAIDVVFDFDCSDSTLCLGGVTLSGTIDSGNGDGVLAFDESDFLIRIWKFDPDTLTLAALDFGRTTEAFVPSIFLTSFDNGLGGCCNSDGQSITITAIGSPVSEPGTLALLAAGLAGMCIARRRRAAIPAA